MTIAFTNARLIEGTGAETKSKMTIVVNGSKITEIGLENDFGTDTLVIDLAGKTLMPGLIDTHNHMAPWMLWLMSEQKDYLMKLAAKTAYFMRASLEAGCTCVRDVGGLEAGFVEAQSEGLIPGPRLQTSVIIIQPTNGLLDFIPGLGGAITRQGITTTAPGLPTPWCNGPWEVRAKVREVLRYGADFIKIANSDPDLTRTLFTSEEIEAAVDEAHRAGRPVSCHAESLEAALQAVRAGVDIIDHGTNLNEECVEEMVKRGTWLVPTLTNIKWHATSNPDIEFREAIKPVAEAADISLALAHKAGVKIAMGTDAVHAAGMVGVELDHLVNAGMTPNEAILTSTLRGAQCMALDDKIGSVEIGKEADLIILDGDPMSDISILSDVDKISLVMQAGVPVSGQMSQQLTWKPSAPLKLWI